jgi:hypothetical protein
VSKPDRVVVEAEVKVELAVTEKALEEETVPVALKVPPARVTVPVPIQLPELIERVPVVRIVPPV